MNAQPAEVCPFDRQRADFPKGGPAPLIDNCVSAIVADQTQMDRQFKQLADDINKAVPGKGLVQQLRRAKLNRQATDGVAAYAITQAAMPVMTAWHREHGNLIPDCTDFDYHTDNAFLAPEEPDSALYAQAISAGYWFQQAARSFLGESKADTQHPYHRLHHYLGERWPHYVSVFKAHELDKHEKNNPRDAKWQAADYTYDRNIVGDSMTSVVVPLELLAAAAIHAIIYDKVRAPEKLAPAALIRLPQVLWMASAHNDSGKRLAEKAGLIPNLAPNGALNLLGRQLDRTTSISELVASFLRYRVVADPDFCATETLRHGPPLIPGTCAGDLNVIIPTPEERQPQADFFAEIGLPGIDTATLHTATVSVGASTRQAEVTIFPAVATFLEEHSSISYRSIMSC